MSVVTGVPWPATATTRHRRVALVNPSVGYSDRRKSKPIGLAYIGAFLRERGHDVTGFDFGDSPETPEHLGFRYRLDEYDVVGFSVYNESLVATIEHARWIKARNPGALIVLGGPHATAVHKEIISRYDCVDAVVRREGELPLAALIEARQDLSIAAVAGSTVRGLDGSVVANPDAAFLGELDALPFPDLDFISDSGYGELTFFDATQGVVVPAIAINSSRSCPYNCNFCGVLTIGRKYRVRSAESVVQEVEHFRARDGIGYRHIYFSDANFFVYPAHAMGIIRALHEFDPAITFSFGTRVNQLIRHKEVLPEMKEKGLQFVELGVESASPEVLKRLAKATRPKQNEEAIRLLDKLGVEISLDFIMVDPETTLADLEANRDFLAASGLYDYVPHDHLYTSLSLYAGTPIRDHYAALFDRTWDIEELPEIDQLIIDPYVSWVRQGLLWFRREYQESIDEVLALCEAELQRRVQHRSSAPGSAVEFDLQLLVVGLRHGPNRFFEALLGAARQAEAVGAPPVGGYHELVPALGPVGSVRSLADSLVRAQEMLAKVTRPIRPTDDRDDAAVAEERVLEIPA
jgi:radical SAM superfamily enzyme YgiQ (UPF0313 family)